MAKPYTFQNWWTIQVEEIIVTEIHFTQESFVTKSLRVERKTPSLLREGDTSIPVRELSHPLLFTRALALTVVLSHCEPSHTWSQHSSHVWYCFGRFQMQMISWVIFPPVDSEMRLQLSTHSSPTESREGTNVCGTVIGWTTLSTEPTGLLTWLTITWRILKTLMRTLCLKMWNTSWWPQRYPRT